MCPWGISGKVLIVPANQRSKAPRTNDSDVDEIDRRIVVEVQAEGRLTMAELGRRAGLSAPAVTERLQLKNVADAAVATPEVVECTRITGEDCYIMRANVRDVEHLEEVIDRFAVLGQTTTSIVQSSPVPPRGLALD